MLITPTLNLQHCASLCADEGEGLEDAEEGREIEEYSHMTATTKTPNHAPDNSGPRYGKCLKIHTMGYGGAVGTPLSVGTAFVCRRAAQHGSDAGPQMVIIRLGAKCIQDLCRRLRQSKEDILPSLVDIMPSIQWSQDAW